MVGWRLRVPAHGAPKPAQPCDASDLRGNRGLFREAGQGKARRAVIDVDMADQRRRSATKESHPAERNRAKPLNHGSAYGVTEWGISEQLGCSLREARQMIEEYDRAFHVFRAWQTRAVERALLFGRITSPAGWAMRVSERTSVRTLMNWMMQTLGAQMTQAAAVLLIRGGYTVCATAHDSVMLLVPLAGLEARIQRAQQLMEQVSLSFTRGLRVPTSVDVVRPGKRLLDRETRPMWNLVMRALGLPEDPPEEAKTVSVPATPPFRPSKPTVPSQQTHRSVPANPGSK